MMRIRTGLAAAVIAAAVTMLAGCADLEPASEPAPSGEPSAAPYTDPAAAWLADGSAAALVTWGSSSTACTPVAAEVQASAQTVTVTLAGPPADTACTADFAPRATYVALPKHVDPTKDVILSFAGDGFQGRVPLSGNSALTGKSVPGKPSAGWFADGGIVLLTWGSSSCRPVVQGVTEAKDGATVTFQTVTDQVCTMDVVPRLTLIGVKASAGTTGYTLHLVGDNLDGSTTVIG
ncbi:hypothetical protein [Microbacterium capsulatum]|uniref:Lipoprotein n=1 Tax=Microbacterium capsulatum TaxID=3041921 RepID=A0ABU0XN46_9MICO|nr:hypothetical protein [Microbacterium sp. ASV81]MDQ4215165.1 hypothetical protein [Microbacterium sp. ASV81]